MTYKSNKTGTCNYTNLIVNTIRGRSRVIRKANDIDNKVCDIIDYYKEQLKLLNGINRKSPRLSQDLIASHKGQYSNSVIYKKNFGLLHDGVHPIRALVKLWMNKMIQVSSEVSEECE